MLREVLAILRIIVKGRLIMKTAIVFESSHHGNTKKLIDAIAAKHEVTLIDTQAVQSAELNQYDLIGFAAGIAFGNFYESVVNFASNYLPSNKKVFFIYSCGANDKDFSSELRKLAEARGCTSLGTYSCLGYDTYGPLEAMGGLNKDHPDTSEIQGAVDFFESIIG
jgi:flavodoxin